MRKNLKLIPAIIAAIGATYAVVFAVQNRHNIQRMATRISRDIEVGIRNDFNS